jgi:hypothetical protein
MLETDRPQCWYCGMEVKIAPRLDGSYQIECEHCGLRGPRRKSGKSARDQSATTNDAPYLTVFGSFGMIGSNTTP